jgi:hypothetical protein
MAPISKVKPRNRTPISAEAAAVRSQKRERVRFQRYSTLARVVMPKQTYIDSHAVGTCR